MKKLKIYLDFDGTIVEHDYPRIGRANFGCIEVIKKLQDAGHEIIWNTYRADEKNGTLEDAIRHFNENYWMILKNGTRSDENGLELSPITAFCKNKIQPHPFNWEAIHEFNVLFIDDIAPRIPLKPAVMTRGMMVDWDELDLQFQKNGLY